MLEKKKKESEKPIRLMFQDEARFGRITEIKRCWAPKGIRPVGQYQMVREYTYTYAAASPKEGELVSLVLPDANCVSMNIFLEEVSSRYTEENILMFMDSASWHRANDLKIPSNIDLLFLPPYSPELNPIENLWKEVRQKWFDNKVFKSLSAVEDLLVKALNTLESDRKTVASVTGYKWIIDAILNTN